MWFFFPKGELKSHKNMWNKLIKLWRIGKIKSLFCLENQFEKTLFTFSPLLGGRKEKFPAFDTLLTHKQEITPPNGGIKRGLWGGGMLTS